MLELIHDNRTGKTLEIVVPTFNEEDRIIHIINYYSPEFDVVVLDDDSSDETQQRVISAGGSVYRRTVKSVLGEAHFAHYADALTKSGRVFYLFADEFTPLDEMRQADRHLLVAATPVLGRRIEWLYGARLSTSFVGGPRGFQRGTAQWVEGSIHKALRHRPAGSDGVSLGGAGVSSCCVAIHHLHVALASAQYGTTGKYARLEIADFQKSRWPFVRFLRRFLVSEVVLLPRRLWRERRQRAAVRAQIALLSLTTACIGFLCWVEARFLPDQEAQKAQYAAFYHAGRESEVPESEEL